MGSVTAGTMRPEGAAPGWAARYRVLSLVLAALMGQGKEGAGWDRGIPPGCGGAKARLERIARVAGSEGSGSHIEHPVLQTAGPRNSCQRLSCD